MPIKFNCAKCNKSFTVADSAAGKTGRCSDCGNLNKIPMAQPAASASGAAKQTSMYEVTSSVNGSIFGPADRTTLNQWLKEDRITPQCQIKKVGSERWVEASKFFPQLAEANREDELPRVVDTLDPPEPDPFAKFKSSQPAAAGSVAASTSANPYAAGKSSERKLRVSDQIVPTSGNVGFILNHAFTVYGRSWGIMIGGFFICFATLFGIAIFLEFLSAAIGPAVGAVGGIVNLFVSTYLTAGFFTMALKVGRGEAATLNDCFGSGDRVLPLIGYAFLTSFMFLVPAALIGGVLFVGAQAGGGAAVGVLGGVFIILLSMLAVLLLWPGYFLIVDRKTTVIESFSVAISIAKKNVLQFIAIYFISVIIAWLGLLLFGIGVIATAPLAMLIIICAYLNMSGQIRE